MPLSRNQKTVERNKMSGLKNGLCLTRRGKKPETSQFLKDFRSLWLCFLIFLIQYLRVWSHLTGVIGLWGHDPGQQ